MQNLVRVTLPDGRRILVNEDQISSIEPGLNGSAVIKMANQDSFDIADPPYSQWENDLFLNKK